MSDINDDPLQTISQMLNSGEDEIENSNYSVSVENRFGALGGAQEVGYGEWMEQRNKRRRANTGSVDIETFEILPQDKKLTALFS